MWTGCLKSDRCLPTINITEHGSILLDFKGTLENCPLNAVVIFPVLCIMSRFRVISLLSTFFLEVRMATRGVLDLLKNMLVVLTHFLHQKLRLYRQYKWNSAHSLARPSFDTSGYEPCHRKESWFGWCFSVTNVNFSTRNHCFSSRLLLVICLRRIILPNLKLFQVMKLCQVPDGWTFNKSILYTIHCDKASEAFSPLFSW